jgi:hypothetical protein
MIEEKDPFLDDSMGVPLDTRTGPQHIADLARIAETHPEFAPTPDQVLAADGPAPQPEPEVVAPPVVETYQPEIYDVDGGQVIIEHTRDGWKGTLKGVRTEVFKGRTKDELLTNVLAGKLKATTQLDKLNKELKLGKVTTSQVTPSVRTPVFQNKALTANDIFEIKTALSDNPDLALESWFQKKYGKSFSDLMAFVEKVSIDAEKGVQANEELTVEGISKEFLAATPDYYVCPNNLNNIVGWLLVNKLRRQPTNLDTYNTIMAELVSKELYTVENLTEAWEDLKDSNLAEFEPEEDDEPAPVPPAPVPPAPRAQPVPPAPPANPRIASTSRVQRGGLGIRPGSVSVPAPEPVEDHAPSVDELDNLSEAQLFELKAATDRYRYQQKYGRK